MDSTGSLLYTIIEKVRGFLDDPDVDSKYDNQYLVKHIIAPAVTTVLARVNMTQDNPILLRFPITLIANQEYYTLPPIIQEVWRIAKFDVYGRMQWDWIPENEFHPNGPGWALSNNTLRVWPLPTVTESILLWFTPSGSVCPHFSSGGTVRVFSFGTGQSMYTQSGTTDSTGKVLTVTGAFALYNGFVAANNDQFVCTGGTGATPASYTIASVTPPNTITLTSSVGANAINVSGYVVNTATSMYMQLSNSPLLGLFDRRENAYAGQILRLLTPGGVWQERVIENFDAATRLATFRNPIVNLPGDSNLQYEVMPAFHYAMTEAIAAYSALKLGVMRKISGPHQAGITTQYQMELKTLRDNLSNFQMRTGKYFKKNTIDNPNYAEGLSLTSPLAMIHWM